MRRWIPQYTADPRMLNEEDIHYILIPVPSDASSVELKLRGPKCEIISGKIWTKPDKTWDEILFSHSSAPTMIKEAGG